MYLQVVARDSNNNPTEYVSSEVYVKRDGRLVKASDGIRASRLYEAFEELDKMGAVYDHIWVRG